MTHRTKKVLAEAIHDFLEAKEIYWPNHYIVP